LTANETPTETTFKQVRCGESEKVEMPLLCPGVCKGEGNCSFNFKFEILYVGSKISVAHSKVTVAPWKVDVPLGGPYGPH